MKIKKTISLLAVMLCVAALFVPLTAYAATDTKPPDTSAWLNGEVLHAEVRDDESGVEALYIGAKRYNYFVDGVIEVPLKECAGTDEYITVYAIDFAGNKSKPVEIKNPQYRAPSATTPPASSSQTQPAPPPAASSTSQPTSSAPSASSTSQPTSSSAPASSSTSSSTSQPTSSSAATGETPTDPQDAVCLTPDGTGTVVDDVTEDQGKEFFTFSTADGNIFYMILDRASSSNNVYLLNAVTEADLAALAEKNGGSIPATETEIVPTPEPTPTPEPEAEPEPPAKESGSGGTIIFVLLALAAAGGAGWYFKIYRPKQQQMPAAPEDDDMGFEDDDEYDEDEYDDSGDEDETDSPGDDEADSSPADRDDEDDETDYELE